MNHELLRMSVENERKARRQKLAKSVAGKELKDLTPEEKKKIQKAWNA